MEIDYVSMGLRITRRRKQLKIKQNVLAEMIDISNNYLSSIERGKEKPSLEVMVKICNALSVTPDYLLMGNMHSDNIPQAIVDGLRLCSEDDIKLLHGFMQMLVERHEGKWNSDNYC